MHFYKLGKDTSWELSGLLQKGQSKAEDMGKEYHSSHAELQFTQANHQII